MRSYKPLDLDKNEIRLLRIFPSLHDSDKVRFSMRYVSLSDSPAYIALSYTWGSLFQHDFVELNGKIVRITSNLEAALRQVRNRGRSIDIWVDALCIDRRSQSERAAQVLRMFGIYQKAQEVLVWLGSDKDGSNKVMRMLAESQGTDLLGENEKLLTQPTDDDTAQPTFEELQAFLSRSYWQRIWII
jgi:hypothetical protein